MKNSLRIINLQDHSHEYPEEEQTPELFLINIVLEALAVRSVVGRIMPLSPKMFMC